MIAFLLFLIVAILLFGSGAVLGVLGHIFGLICLAISLIMLASVTGINFILLIALFLAALAIFGFYSK
jgi:hypothetical protein